MFHHMTTKLTSYRDDKLLFKPECYCGPGQTARDETTGICTDASTKQDEWQAWWSDIKTPACLENIKEVHTARIVDAAGKGCDAIDPDNVDSVRPPRSHTKKGLTCRLSMRRRIPTATPRLTSWILTCMFLSTDLANHRWLAETAHANGLAIDLKNAGGLLQTSAEYSAAVVAAFDYNVIESCVSRTQR